MNTEKTLMTFVRSRNNQPRGVIVAGFDEVSGCVRMGWSYTNLKAGDRFNKKLGVKIAADRIYSEPRNKKIPHEVMRRAGYFAENCRRFFKTDNILVAGM